jgi:hypothetical protein
MFTTPYPTSHHPHSFQTPIFITPGVGTQSIPQSLACKWSSPQKPGREGRGCIREPPQHSQSGRVAAAPPVGRKGKCTHRNWVASPFSPPRVPGAPQGFSKQLPSIKLSSKCLFPRPERSHGFMQQACIKCLLYACSGLDSESQRKWDR